MQAVSSGEATGCRVVKIDPPTLCDLQKAATPSQPGGKLRAAGNRPQQQARGARSVKPMVEGGLLVTLVRSRTRSQSSGPNC
jgi:hypothetical protein